jgi:hypothetical protein
MMIRNLPLDVSQFALLKMLDKTGFAGKYDFVYLPFSFTKKTNIGYAFINLVSPSIALSFREAWNCTSHFHDELPGDQSKGMVTVTVAQVQGKEGNVQRLLNECRCSKITNPKFQPVVYDQAGARLDFSQMMNQGESQESSVLREI